MVTHTPEEARTNFHFNFTCRPVRRLKIKNQVRLTYKKLVWYINEALDRVESGLIAIEAYNPRYTSDQLERGAALIVVRIKRKGDNDSSFFTMHSVCYRIKDFEEEINKGAVIGFDLTPFSYSTVPSWRDAEIKPIFL